MRILTEQEVKKKIEELNRYIFKEKQLQEEILSLKISGSKDNVKKNIQRHNEILHEIEELRMTKMLPILDELGKFVGYCQKVEKGLIKLGDPWPGEEQGS